MKILKYSSIFLKYLHPKHFQIFKKRNIITTTPKPGFREWWVKQWYGSQPSPQNWNVFQQLFALKPSFKLLATLFIATLLCIPPIYFICHIYKTPITGRLRFLMFTPHQFDEISTALYKLYVSEYRNEILPDNRPEYTNVIRVANKLINANNSLSQLRNKKWTVTVVDQPHYNIVALQSGQIFVYRRMLSICSRDDHLAAVLSHELAHAIMGHAAELTNEANFSDKLWMLFLLCIWTILPYTPKLILNHIVKKLKSHFLTVSYTPTMEEEADRVALKMTAMACYDVRESSALWKAMEALESTYSKPLVEWLYVHPDRRRSDRFNALIPEALLIREVLNCPKLHEHYPRLNLE